ncbi:MAG: cupin [SAR202 cluster bacterium]|nr:cupin [SAR202 cluster bacterium]|tara:strand:- start:2987 stop:3346 length:360 start_codon:yes stop_codon:yes gene_type:complete
MQVLREIPKPWGTEHIIDINDTYCVKSLLIKAGQRLSKQFHQQKRETILLTSGEATLILYNGSKSKEVVMKHRHAYAIEPRQIHRIFAHSDFDAILIEVSTIELDDVVRLEDDYGRCSS